jgi:stage V sporulation protein D (sporulation-specific penicillin-binding protein)
MGFGQAVAVTPLQLITAICGVLNGGTMFQPSLVKKITAPDGKVVFENTVTPVNTVVNKDVSQLMNIMMEETVSKPGKYTFIPGYEMGGKTGTTQKYENGKISGKYISSFLGAYPASKPEYVVLVIVDEPGTGQYYGSIVASPYAKEIFQGIFEYKNIAPTHLNQANQILSQQITMPSLVGKSLTEAVSILIKHGLSYEIAGDGGIITKQLPPAGTLINKATSVVICAE